MDVILRRMSDGRFRTKIIYIPLPATDENGTPLSKMPNCPKCGEDELGMLHPGEAFCYRCGVQVLNPTPPAAQP